MPTEEPGESGHARELRVPVIVIGLCALVSVAGFAIGAALLATDRFNALASAISASSAVVSSAATVVVLLIGFHQLREGRDATKAGRVIKLHEDLTSGEVGSARHRLSSHLWASRSEVVERDGINRRVISGRIGYLELDPRDGEFGIYPESQATIGCVPLQDMYKILWGVERISMSLKRGLLDRTLTFEMLGGKVTWWDMQLEPTAIPVPERNALRELALLMWAEASPSLRAEWFGEIEGSTSEALAAALWTELANRGLSLTHLRGDSTK